MDITMAVLVVTALGLLGALILVIASQYLSVEEDPRVEQIKEVLPSVNCGACGYAGCADYAEAVVNGGAAVSLCVPGGADCAAAIADVMGSEAGDVAAQKAVVACGGSCDHITEKYQYTGIETCAACANLHGGVSSCPFGCLGFGDCKVACKFDAIVVENGLARVVPEKCTGCRACEEACPKQIIWIRPVSNQPAVLCENRERGAQTRKECDVGCIGCMKCQKTCPEDAIHVIDNVARIDLEKCTGCGACVGVCPVKCIDTPLAV